MWALQSSATDRQTDSYDKKTMIPRCLLSSSVHRFVTHRLQLLLVSVAVSIPDMSRLKSAHSSIGLVHRSFPTVFYYIDYDYLLYVDV